VVREVREETGFDVEVTGYLGTWVHVYTDDPRDLDAGVINVAYYAAVLVPGSERGPVDPAEVSEVAWFGWDELPADLAPPGTLEAVLAVARLETQASRPRSGRL